MKKRSFVLALWTCWVTSALGSDESRLLINHAGTTTEAGILSVESGDDASFTKAVDAEDIETVRALIKKGIKGQFGAVEMEAAIGKGDIEKVKSLLDQGVDPNTRLYGGWGAQTGWGPSPLMIAANKGELEIARLLLDRGAKPELVETLTGRNAAVWALRSSRSGSARVLELMVEKGLNLKEKPAVPPIMARKKSTNAEWEKRLANWGNALVFTAAMCGRDALNYDPTASSRKVRLLARAGYDVNFPRAISGDGLELTPLAAVVAEGRYQGRESQLNVIRELLAHGAKVNAQDTDGCTPLHYAVINMDAAMVELLLEAGADPKIADKGGDTPLALAETWYPRNDVLNALGAHVADLPEEAILARILPSRTRGVAPLCVFFDAAPSDGLAGDDYRNAWFDWDFDATGIDPSHPRRTGIGFNVGHVFRKPGTYEVRVHVKDTEGRTGQTNVKIEVLPFEGKTYHVSADGNDDNDGSINAPLRTPAAVVAHAAPGTRILFRRGDTFASGLGRIADRKGPVLIGAYTDPRKKSEAPPLFDVKSFAGLVNVEDWRIEDLKIRGRTTVRRGKDSGMGIHAGNCRHVLLRHLEMENLGSNGMTVVRSHGWFVTDCHFHDLGAYAMFIAGCRRNGILGNRTERMHSFEQGYRQMFTKKSYIAHNVWPRNIGDCKTALTVRNLCSDVVIAFNQISNTMGNAANTDNQLGFVHTFLVDSNVFTCGSSWGAQRVTIRRNRMKHMDLIEVNGKRHASNPYFLNLHSHMDATGLSEQFDVYQNTYIGPGPFLRGPGAKVRVLDNIILIDNPIPFHAIKPSEVRSDRNRYYCTGKESAGLAEWLLKTRELGHDRNSEIEQPRFVSQDLSDPDFLQPIE
jgi:ankyrin repeat protein